MDKKMNFLYTTSEITKQKLIDLGYEQVEQGIEGRWLFINKGTLTFSAKDEVVYTNKLFI